MGQLLDRENYQECYKDFELAIVQVAGQVGKQLKRDIHITRPVLEEAFCAALASVDFHGIPKPKFNLYKEVAHIAFWIIRLKPAQIFEEENASGLWDVIRKWFDGPVAKIVGPSEVADQPDKPHPDPARTVNERIALEFVLLAMDGLAKEVDVSDQADDLKSLQNRKLKFHKERIARLGGPLVEGFRYYSFSARSFTIFIENMMSVEASVFE